MIEVFLPLKSKISFLFSQKILISIYWLAIKYFENKIIDKLYRKDKKHYFLLKSFIIKVIKLKKLIKEKKLLL